MFSVTLESADSVAALDAPDDLSTPDHDFQLAQARALLVAIEPYTVEGQLPGERTWLRKGPEVSAARTAKVKLRRVFQALDLDA